MVITQASWIDIVWAAVVAFAILAAVSQLSLWLVAISIIAAVVAHVVSSRQTTNAARADHIKRQIDELYAPWTKVAKARIQRAASDYGPRFQQHMESELGQLHRHLAEPATLAAYNQTVRGGKWGGEADLRLAHAFLEDYERLVEEFRRLTRTGPFT